MSRDWNEHKYCSAENLWCWIDEQGQGIEGSLDWVGQHGGDSYKLLLMGRREMLNAIGTWLHENETLLGEIAERWGLREKK